MIDSKRVLAVIPARFGSTRFPGKPLALLHGIPMILWTAARTAQSRYVDAVFVATDDNRIVETVQKAGGDAILTDADLTSGSDRVAVVAQRHTADIIVNVQGDEPLIRPEHIDAAVKSLAEHPECLVSTLATPVNTSTDVWDENIVKVIYDSRNRALYFSRAPLPYPGKSHGSTEYPANYMRHIGLYAFRRNALFAFTEHPPCTLEKVERLEQLRMLYAGMKISVAVVSDAATGVDTQKDLREMERYISEKKIDFPSGKINPGGWNRGN